MLRILAINACLLFLKDWYLRIWSIALILFFSLFTLQINFGETLINEYLQRTNVGLILTSLTILISLLMLLSTQKPLVKNTLMSFLILLLNLNLILVFLSSRMFSMYFFFEFSLIPTLILILGWGYQPERLQAGVYLILYTFTASMPLLFVLLYLHSVRGSAHMLSLSIFQSLAFPSFVILIASLAFLVKLPIYMAHLWLPKAHVEAPLAGSIVLAGILLKLGGYGLYQMYFIFSFNYSLLSTFFISLAIWGGLITMFICYRQSDLKALIAYSSIGHIGAIVAGLLIFSSWGVKGAILIIVAHGLCSSALFCLANFTYEKFNTRRIPLIKGILSYVPNLSFWWFIFCAINMACPPSLNLLGELIIFPAFSIFSYPLLIPLGLMTFIGAVYNMYLYTTLNQGTSLTNSLSWGSLDARCNLSLFLHFFPYFLILKPIIF